MNERASRSVMDEGLLGNGGSGSAGAGDKGGFEKIEFAAGERDAPISKGDGWGRTLTAVGDGEGT